MNDKVPETHKSSSGNQTQNEQITSASPLLLFSHRAENRGKQHNNTTVSGLMEENENRRAKQFTESSKRENKARHLSVSRSSGSCGEEK